jgi:hypothetical protein
MLARSPSRRAAMISAARSGAFVAAARRKLAPGPWVKRCRTLLPPPGSSSIRYRHDEDGRKPFGNRLSAAGPRPHRRPGPIMVPGFGLAGVQPAHGDQAEPEVAHFGQVSSPCSAGWSASTLLMTVSSPRPLICRPSNQAAHRPSRTPATRISYRAGPPEALTPAPASARPERQSVPCPAVRMAPAAKTCSFLAGGAAGSSPRAGQINASPATWWWRSTRSRCRPGSTLVRGLAAQRYSTLHARLGDAL